MASDDEDASLVHFLESEVLSGLSEMEEEERDMKRPRAEEGQLSEQEEKEQQEAKKIRIDEGEISDEELSRVLRSSSSSSLSSVELEAEVKTASSPPKGSETVISGNSSRGRHVMESKPPPKRIETGIFSHIPPELLYHILKFLSSEDLVSCTLVCRFMSFAASDESLWRRLYCMRWGLLPPKKPRECAWKNLYIKRDEEDMAEFVRSCPTEFKEYYIQMQVAKRSQAPNRSQVNDDRIILDKTLADQVSIWKSSRGLTETAVPNHACSGENCTYYQIGDVFVCEKTGNVHVCDDTCKDVIMDPTNELLVCTISGRCFDRLISPDEMEPDVEQQQAAANDEAEEPFMGSGRFARAYLLGYNCDDEKELEAALRFC
ncbi:F-box protein SKIP31 isoform X1 [Salvia hispanica]|uniref:F-box protein SKIP31 isoform X1 n=1 Tax=Salvia hispanica TaxID=49212 RepID=UPI0020099CC0|nr:F-box protein SKIP31 isoform X1 [Salvia hispanica]